MDAFGGLIATVLAFGVLFLFYIMVPARMASVRNRSALAWVLVSLFGSPFLAIFLLLLFGARKS